MIVKYNVDVGCRTLISVMLDVKVTIYQGKNTRPTRLAVRISKFN